MAHQTTDLRTDLQLPSSAPIDSRKRAELLRDKIVELIRDGHLREGEKIPTEPQLAAMFGVGRSTVREAVQSLKGLGLIEMRPGRGAFVRRMSLGDLVRMVDGAVQLEFGAALQMHEVRSMIEITAARLAAVRRTEDDLAAMREALLRTRVLDVARNPVALVDTDLAFHAAVCNASHNEPLIKFRESVAGLLRDHRGRYGAPDGSVETRQVVVDEHERIFGAIAASNPAAAQRFMQRHMQLIWEQIAERANREGDETFSPEDYILKYDDVTHRAAR
jgi:GntR family transcriptional repressor for pyruvate dehydrogenase complex